jgi:hypothetical protein
MPPPDAPPAPLACLNCGRPWIGPRPRFCPDCGQESNVKPPTLIEFAQQFGGSMLATEGALWRTLRLLLFRPGELTLQYLAGRRRHYVLPLRLYLTVSVVVLLIARIVAGVQIDPDASFQFDAKDRNSLKVHIGPGQAGMRDGKFYCDDLPGWLCRRLQRRIDVDPRSLQREAAQLSERFVGNLGAAMFVMLPAFALWLKLAWWDRRLRYTEHLVFALHLHAFWFLALALALPGLGVLTFAAFVAVPVYALRSIKRVYGGALWSRWLRAAGVSLMYLLTLAVVTVGLGLWTLLA